MFDTPQTTPAEIGFVIEHLSDLQGIREWFEKGATDLYLIAPAWMPLLGGVAETPEARA